MTCTKNAVVLVVEPDLAFRTALVGIIESEGYSAPSIPDIRGALDSLEVSETPRVIVLGMPHSLDADQFLAQLRQEAEFAWIPVVIIAEPVLALRCHDLHPYAILERSVEVERLIEVVHHAVMLRPSPKESFQTCSSRTTAQPTVRRGPFSE